ncbi:hypothetical protein E4U60_001626 [Claviceps pazoutovae]|uniref:Uncharacterized protein n=1 Tax=Claviceps pazoutovae TaxID=1649127 RepID=A0A9P7MCJ4_9HYPO|nr:hypothetical protein E4U60_001626 [Claviceps pazoutovae]
MNSLKPIASTAHVTLDLPPSCVQFCPSDDRFFVVGTYNLEKDSAQTRSVVALDQNSHEEEDLNFSAPQSRNGSLLLFLIDGSSLNLVQTELQPSALLDLRFHRSYAGKQSILAVVSSTGSLSIYGLDPQRSPALRQLATSRCEDLGKEVLFLQCNWHPSLSNTIAVTTSTGLARLLYLDVSWRIDGWTDLGIQNSLEAWSINLADSNNQDQDNAARSTMIYCGGDDSTLRYISCSWPKGADKTKVHMAYSPVSIRGQHNAGVTAILPLPYRNPDGGRIVLSGSYDDHLRVFVIHDLHESYGAKKVRLLCEINLGGGVWRLNLIDFHCSESSTAAITEIRVLASCMYAGARIVTISTRDGQSWDASVLGRFEEHESMNYASDFIKASQGRGLRCVSTSFYDKLLCLWEYEQPNCRDRCT